jgi:hypothetical protein
VAQRFYNFAAWWHLLSLDAPTVAALWSWFFARAMHLHLPLMQALFLGLGTWLLYVSDRILDGLGHRPSASLRERHHFHARHRAAFLAVASVLALLLAWFVGTHMRPEVLRDDTWIGVLALLYLFAVHSRAKSVSTSRSRLPKELAVAVLFAVATAVPAWTRLRAGKEQLAPAVLLFAALCWINCVGIETWEATTPPAAHATTRWAGLHLRSIVTTIALFSMAAALLAPSRGLMAVYFSALLSSGFLFALDLRRTSLSPLHLRIAADAALLTPLAMLPFSR